MIVNPDILYAQKLRALRIVKGYKQEVIAKKLNMSQQVYSKLEFGKKPFTDNLIQGICDLFEISPEEFTSTTGFMNIQSNSPHAYGYANNVNALESLMSNFLQEIQQSREERKAFIQVIERLINSKEK